MNLRALSLDRTTPHDYEPQTLLPWDADLTAMADHFGSDKGTIKHGYTKHYEELLCDRRQYPIELLEIGVACGASLKMWSSYFPFGTITGVDIRPECKALCRDYKDVRIVIADATVTPIPGRYDVIVDDGSHLPGQIVKAFALHWPWLLSRGLYCIEDLACTHNPNYSVPFPHDAKDKDRGSFINLVDQLLRLCDKGEEVASVRFYPQLAVIEKK